MRGENDPKKNSLSLDDRAAERPAELVADVRLLVVLHVADRLVVDRAQHETLHRAGAQRAAGEVVVRFTGEDVAARLGDRADDAAERAAVLGGNAGRLDLHFLDVLEHGVLPRRPLIRLVVSTPSTVNAFSAPLAPFTWKPPSISP